MVGKDKWTGLQAADRSLDSVLHPGTDSTDPCSGAIIWGFRPKQGEELDGWMNETPSRAASENSILMAAAHPPPVRPSVHPFILDAPSGPNGERVPGNLRHRRARPPRSPKLSGGSRQVTQVPEEKNFCLRNLFHATEARSQR